MQDGNYVKEMERMANEGRVIEEGGMKYSSLNMKPVFYEPRPDAVQVRTLSALITYMKDNVDKIDLSNLLVLIESPETVSVLSAIYGKDRRRDKYIAAKADAARFRFGEWLSPEQFVISLNALFVPSDDLFELLNYTSRLKVENEASISDDGVSQAASVRMGIKGSLSETKPAPARIRLRPYRTFAEVAQPESDFIFRMRYTGNDVSLSLHEADNGAWKIVAMANVADWIKEKMQGISPVSVIY